MRESSENKAIAKLRAAARMQQRYNIAAMEMASVLGIAESTYRKRLLKLGLVSAHIENPFGLYGEAAGIMVKLQTELARLANDSGLPDKSSADALTALARTVKTVVELMREGSAEPETGVNTHDDLTGIGAALEKIDRRINELAGERAAEILRRRTECAAENSIEQGVVVSGA
ncbi:hypothetical protein [Paenochrobactrum pullorum]|uniref:hypothetical protein n=1 Tax=Paenochrobactrum pullorum TaxID=1324351 RepID=UPI0035BC91C4